MENRVVPLPSPEAVNDWISNRSVALLLTPEEGSLYVGSAVAIEICGRLFLATAAHNFEGITASSQIRALPGGRRLERPLHILDWNFVQNAIDGDVDVAWLEVEFVSASASSVSFLSIDNLSCGTVHQENTVFPVQGYPQASVDRDDVFEGVPLLCGTSVFSFSMPPSTSSLDFQDGIDLLLEWPPSDLQDTDVEVPHPSGVSGGGVWLMPRYSETPVWTCPDLRLVALSRAWRRGTRQLVATRIEQWLRLLAEDHPYTRREIDPLLDSVGTR